MKPSLISWGMRTWSEIISFAICTPSHVFVSPYQRAVISVVPFIKRIPFREDFSQLFPLPSFCFLPLEWVHSQFLKCSIQVKWKRSCYFISQSLGWFSTWMASIPQHFYQRNRNYFSDEYDPCCVVYLCSVFSLRSACY
jgi:hypothetical protein